MEYRNDIRRRNRDRYQFHAVNLKVLSIMQFGKLLYLPGIKVETFLEIYLIWFWNRQIVTISKHGYTSWAIHYLFSCNILYLEGNILLGKMQDHLKYDSTLFFRFLIFYFINYIHVYMIYQFNNISRQFIIVVSCYLQRKLVLIRMYHY